MKPISLVPDTKPHLMKLNTIDELLADIRAGRMVVLMDDEDRENEGDLIMAAEHVRAEDINFMAHYGRGLICLTLTRERCRQLRLPLMVSDTNVDHRTNFTLSIEAAEGVTTGISAHDRAHTIRTAVRREARAEDLRQPGHIFPIMAQPGGVLTRAGHTEAGCDLTRLAGLEPAAAIVEILNDDGTMARRPDLEKFVQRHRLKIGTIADLIRYRLEKERSVERIAEQIIDDRVRRVPHVRLRGPCQPHGAPGAGRRRAGRQARAAGARAPEGHARRRRRNSRPALGWPLRSAMQRIAQEGHGVIVILRPDETPRDLMDAVQSIGRDPAAPSPQAGAKVLRTYGIGAQILRDLGVRRMRVLSAPKQMHGLSGFDLEVVEYVDG